MTNQLAQRDLSFHAGEGSSDAEVDAVAEPEVSYVGSTDVERGGMAIPRWVAVRGCKVDDDLRAGGDRGAAELDRLDRVAEGRVRGRRVEANELLHGGRHQRGFGAQPGELLRVLEQCDEPLPPPHQGAELRSSPDR